MALYDKEKIKEGISSINKTGKATPSNAQNTQPTSTKDTSQENKGFISSAVNYAKNVVSSIPESFKRDTKAISDNIKNSAQNVQNYFGNNDYKSRNDFATDTDYERYLVTNNVPTTKGDALNYIKQKSKESGQNLRQYSENMFKNMQSKISTENMRNEYANGNLSEDSIKMLEENFGVYVDSNNKKIDYDNLQNSINTYQNTANQINSEIEKLNSSYEKGKIDYTTLQSKYAELTDRWNQNESFREELANSKLLTGFDYYDWALENGEDVSDFENYVGHFDDHSIERLSESFAASLVDTASLNIDMVNMARYLITSDESAFDGKITTALKNSSAELHTYATANGTMFDQLSNGALSSILPQIEETMLMIAIGAPAAITAVLPKVSEATALSAATSIALGSRSGSETIQKRIEEGCDPTVTKINALTHWAISAATELLNAGNITNIVLGDAEKYLLTANLFSGPNFLKLLGYYNNIGTSEAAEELIEAEVTKGADYLTNLWLTSQGKEPIKVEQLDKDELIAEMAMAYTGAVIMGTPTVVNVTVGSRRTRNAAMEIKNYNLSVINSELSSEYEKELARISNEFIDSQLNEYSKKASSVANGVTFETDIPASMGTYDEAVKNLANALRPDVKDNLQSALKTYANSVALEDLTQSSLYKRGIDIKASQYIDLSEQARANTRNVADYANKLGVNVRFDTSVSESGSYDPNTKSIVVNPNSKLGEVSTFVHEVTHLSENSSFYETLSKIINESFSDNKTVEINNIKNTYRKNGVNLNPDLAEREYVAYRTQMELGNKDFVEKLIKYNKSLAYRMYRNILGMFDSDIKTQLETTFMEAFRDANSKDAVAGTVVNDYNSSTEQELMDFLYNDEDLINAFGLLDGYTGIESTKGNLNNDSRYAPKTRDEVLRENIDNLIYAMEDELSSVIEDNEIPLTELSKYKDFLIASLTDPYEAMDNNIYDYVSDEKLDKLGELFVNNFIYNNERISDHNNHGVKLTPEQEKFFRNSKITDENGNLVTMYHGTARADRVGNTFRTDRATSGPMAFFTDNPAIAQSYASGKQDTSLAYDEEDLANYNNWFKYITQNGEKNLFDNYWLLPRDVRKNMAERAPHITIDFDSEGSPIIYDPNNTKGVGNYDYELESNNGNVLEALKAGWLDGGTLFGTEERFLEVLEMVGMDMSKVHFNDPDFRDEKVYEVYLNVTNPFNTEIFSKQYNYDENGNFTQKKANDFLNGLINYLNENGYDMDERGEAYSDYWDKNSWTPNEWIDNLRFDMKHNKTDSWTSIPDFVTDYLKSEGYDGIVDNGGKNGGVNHTVVIPFYAEQIKDVNNENPTQNTDIRYDFNDGAENTEGSGSTDYSTEEGIKVPETPEEAHNSYFDYGRNPVRNVDIPRATDAGPTSRFWNNLANSAYVSDEEAQRIKKQVEDGLGAYESKTNKQQRKQAREMLRQMGMEDSFKYAMNADSLATADVDTVFCKELLSEMNQKGLSDTENYRQLEARIAWRSTMSGRAEQAFNTFRTQTPEGQAITIRSEIERIQQGLNDRYGEGAYNVEINEELLQDYLTAKSDEERETIRLQLAQDVARQIPPSLIEQLNSYRHLSMLFNPRTWIKNKLSNTLFGYVDQGTRMLRSTLEQLAYARGQANPDSMFAGMKKEAGTYNPLDSNQRRLYNRLIEDYKTEFKNLDMKYSNIDAGNVLLSSEFGELVAQNRDQFTSKFLNKISDINAKMLSDAPAMQKAYARAMIGYLNANNLDYDTATEEQLEKAKSFAINEARYATFNSINQLANDIVKFSNERGPIGRAIIESFLPFKRTPLNLIKTGFRYTPVGLAETLVFESRNLKNGKTTANQYINNLAQGMTGTAIMALGMLLAHLGIFKTKDDDKDRKQYFDKENGEQEYAIDLGSGTYTIDWLDPIIVPLAMGAELVKWFEDGTYSLDELMNLVYGLADPMFETSMLSGISKNLSSYASNTTQWWGKIASNAITNYVSQYIPSIMGATARTIDDTRRSTYTDGGSFEKFYRQTMNKIPGVSMLNEPYINRQGEEEKNEDLGAGIFGRAFLNFVSPGYYSSKDIDEYDEEMYRLYDETGDISVFPSSTSSSVTFDKVPYDFTEEDYTNWHQTRWQTETEYVDQFMDSEVYKNLSDEERISTIKDIRDYAQKVAKKDFLESRGISYEDDKQLNNAQGALDHGIELYAYYDYLNNAGTKQADKIAYLESSGFSKEEKEYLWSLNDYKTSYEDAYAKIMGESNKDSSGKSKSSGSSKKASTGSSGGASGGTLNKASAVPSQLKQGSVENLKANITNNNYLTAYTNQMNNRRASSSGSSVVICPNCGNRVNGSSGVCPICGHRL